MKYTVDLGRFCNDVEADAYKEEGSYTVFFRDNAKVAAFVTVNISSIWPADDKPYAAGKHGKELGKAIAPKP